MSNHLHHVVSSVSWGYFSCSSVVLWCSLLTLLSRNQTLFNHFGKRTIPLYCRTVDFQVQTVRCSFMETSKGIFLNFFFFFERAELNICLCVCVCLSVRICVCVWVWGGCRKRRGLHSS